SWRLLAGGLAPWLSHRSYSTTSAEPPLSNFNSYWDIPDAGGHRHGRRRVGSGRPRRWTVALVAVQLASEVNLDRCHDPGPAPAYSLVEFATVVSAQHSRTIRYARDVILYSLNVVGCCRSAAVKSEMSVTIEERMHKNASWLVTAAVCMELVVLADRRVAQTGADKAKTQPPAVGTLVITLGTAGGPLPRKDRAQSSNLLVVNRTLYLIDAGG